MSVCLIGKNLSSLLLSKILINKGIKVDLYFKNRKYNNSKKNMTRTLGLSNNSINFLINEKILKKKFLWGVKEIELYRQKSSEKFLTFKSEKNCFSIIKYNDIYKLLNNSLYGKKLFCEKKILNESFFSNLIKKNRYEIVINTDINNQLFRKCFSNQIKKDYQSIGFTTIINHSKLSNKVAVQHFTKHGPLAFLPISKSKTSVVFSVFDKELIKDEKKIELVIKKFNKKYNIKSIEKFEKFPINLSLSRNYFYKNILSFGDSLHKIHPIAGQGFNMTVRDALVLSNLLKDNLEIGLNLSTVLEKFEKKRKSSNFLFATGINFLHEFFKFTNKYDFGSIDKLFRLLDQNKYIKSKLQIYADRGINL